MGDTRFLLLLWFLWWSLLDPGALFQEGWMVNMLRSMAMVFAFVTIPFQRLFTNRTKHDVELVFYPYQYYRKRIRYPRNYMIRRRLLRRKSNLLVRVLVNGAPRMVQEVPVIPWDSEPTTAELLQDYKKKHLHVPFIQCGPSFYRYVRSLDPLLYYRMATMSFNSAAPAASTVPVYYNSFRTVDQLLSGSVPSAGAVYLNSPDTKQFPVIIDTGASISITGVRDDFIPGHFEPLQEASIGGLNHRTTVSGAGRVRWNLRDPFGTSLEVECEALYVEGADVRLLSPQSLFQLHRTGALTVDQHFASIHLADSMSFVVPYSRESNLPMAFEDPQVRLTTLDIDPFSSTEVCMAVTDERNQNLTRAQKSLLLWHQKLGHAGFEWIKQLFTPSRSGLPPVLSSKEGKAMVSCESPKCAACLFARQTLSGSGSVKLHKDPNQQLRLKEGDLNPGDCVSMDQYVSPSQRGRLLDGCGKEKDKDKYYGGTIFVDHATSKIFVRHQVSLRAGETIQSKREFEYEAAQHGVTIQSYHSDNGVFDSAEFRGELQRKGQGITFSGVGAHHQNGVAERAIRTVTEWARAMLMHAALHWPEMATLETWPYALDYATHLWNELPRKDLRLSPNELFSKTQSSYEAIRRARVWGCPVYVLDPVLQNGKKLPKWQPRSRRGQFMGVSKEHATNVGLILNPRTGCVSPQYHVVYDDKFQTVPNVDNGDLPFPETVWDDLFRNQREVYIDEDIDPANAPQLHEDWLDDDERQQRRSQDERRFERRYGRRPGNLDADPLPQVPTIPADDDDDDDVIVPVNQPPVQPVQPQQPVVPPQQQDQGAQDQGVRRSTRIRRAPVRYPQNLNILGSQSKIRSEVLNRAYISNLDWSALQGIVKSRDMLAMMNVMESFTNPKTGLVEDWHPGVFATVANAADNPSYHEAVNGPDSQGYIKAMEEEIETLTKKDSWDIVDRTPDMHVLDSTWVLRCKRFPDGSVRKLKARFCVRGDQQIAGVDYFDTYAPVVQWSTVRLLLMTSLMLNLYTQQVDYTCAFLHAPITETVYCQMPRGFREPGKVYKLKRSLYGLRQSPKNFFEHLKGKLCELGFEQSQADPCLFIHDAIICVTYVDDCLFFSPTEGAIDDMIERLKQADMELTKESDVAGFLGVKIDRKDDGTMELLQVGLIDRIITALGLDGGNTKKTPASTVALPKDEDGDLCNDDFNYGSVVGMLMYLAGHSRPDIGFAVHQCARYLHQPRHSHEVAVKHIGRYLLGTRNRGLVLKPNGTMKVDMYVDAAFAGLWGSEDKHDPACVKSRSGYVIFVGGCPILWGSKMQTEIALSTMESEYIALSESMKHLICLKRLIVAISRAIGFDKDEVMNIKSTVFEDNSACLILGKLEPPRMTPRTKHFAIKYHWFREQLEPNNIELQHVNTEDQIADILTKGLVQSKFELLRKMLMGW